MKPKLKSIYKHVLVACLAVYKYILNHKKISAIVFLVAVFLSYSVFKTSGSGATTTQYIFSKAQKQNIVISVTGSGQVSALDQVDLSSEVSGTIDYIGVKAGDSVKK